MKTVILILFIFIGAASAASADDPVMTAVVPAPVQTIWGGVIKSVTRADPVKGTQSEIFVKDTKGKVTPILVTSTTTLWDVDAKAIMLDKITPRKRVNVIYLPTAEGLNVGKSIKILK